MATTWRTHAKEYSLGLPPPSPCPQWPQPTLASPEDPRRPTEWPCLMLMFSESLMFNMRNQGTADRTRMALNNTEAQLIRHSSDWHYPQRFCSLKMDDQWSVQEGNLSTKMCGILVLRLGEINVISKFSRKPTLIKTDDYMGLMAK